jgi:hypothetical protein
MRMLAQGVSAQFYSRVALDKNPMSKSAQTEPRKQVDTQNRVSQQQHQGRFVRLSRR